MAKKAQRYSVRTVFSGCDGEDVGKERRVSRNSPHPSPLPVGEGTFLYFFRNDTSASISGFR